MESKRNDAGSTKEKPFPKLQEAIHSRNVYLMTEPTKGILVCKGPMSSVSFAHARINLSADLLKDYSGEITLSND